MDVVFEITPAVTVAAHRNVSIAVWRDTPTVASLLRIDGYIGKLREKYEKLAAVVVLDSLTLRPPDQPVRAEHARLTNKYEASSLGVAMIIDGQSAKHSVFRFVLTTIQLMSSPRVPQRIFQSLGQGVSWLATLDRQLTAAELHSAIKDARDLVVSGTEAISA